MADVTYNFSAAGEDAVLNAFRSIDRAAEASARKVQRASAQTAATQRRSARQGQTAQERAARQAAQAQAAAARKAAQAAKATERAQRAAQLRAARHQLRLLEQEKKAREKAAKAVEKAQRQSRIKAARHQLRLLEREKRVRERAARQEARIRSRAARRALRDQQRAASRASQAQAGRRQAIRRGLGRAAGAGLRAVGAVGAATAGVVGLAAREGIALQDRATRLAIKGSKLGAQVDPKRLRQEAQTVAANVRGAKAADVITAQERFVGKTGELGLARKFAEVFAEISVAADTEMGAVGSAAADMYEKFDIKTVEDMSAALAMLAVQGKRGAFEMEDAASQFPKMAAAAARFGLKGVEGLATLGGLSQIARRATPSGEEAATSVENLFKQLVAKSDVIGKLGVEVFKDKGQTQTRDVRDIIVETIGKAEGNLPALQKIFDVRGIRAVSPLISLFNQTRGKELAKFGGKATAKQEADATATAMARLRKEIDDAINVSNARKEIERDLAVAQTATSATLTAAWESVVAAVSDEFTPALTDVVQQLATFVSETDFSGVITGFTAVAEAAGLAAEGLQALGLIKKKEKSPEQVIREAEREVRKTTREEQAFVRQHGGSAAAFRSAETREEFLKLHTKRIEAQEKLEKAQEIRFTGPTSGIEQGLLGTEDFVAQMQATGVSEAQARRLAQGIAGSPNQQAQLLQNVSATQGFLNTALTAVDPTGITGLTFGAGPTEEQRRLTEQFAISQVATQQEQAAPVDTDQANAALQSLSDALGTATAAAKGFGAQSTALQEVL
jgi:hypothetical protein